MLVMSVPMYSGATDSTVDVSFILFDGEVIIPKTEIAVTDGTAELYGYDVAEYDHNGNAVEGATIFDAVVAMHKEYFGDAFTPETADDYLVINSSFITKAFGVNSSALGFFLNDRMPNDGIYNESYGSYTGLACDAAVISEDDLITFYFYQDTMFWGDYKAEFSEDEFVVNENDELTLEVTAFSLWYGNSTDEVIAEYSVKVPGAEIFCSDGAGNFDKIAETDENGNAVISFAEAGEYDVYVTGTVVDDFGDEVPLVIDWATVTVNEIVEEEPPAEEPPVDEPSVDDSDEEDCSVLCWIWNIIKKIISFPVKLVKTIIDWIF